MKYYSVINTGFFHKPLKKRIPSWNNQSVFIGMSTKGFEGCSIGYELYILGVAPSQ